MAFLAATLAVGFGSYAWACGPNNPHTGLFWLCNQGVRCNVVASLSSAPSNSMKWGRATGLSTGSVTYNMRYEAGSHLSASDTACEFSGNIFVGGVNVLPDGTGAIDAVTLTMPNVLGVVTKCVMPGGYSSPSSIPANIKVASRSLLTLT